MSLARLAPLALALFLTSPAFAQGQSALHGPAVTPRAVRFSSLPRRGPARNDVVREREPEGHFPAADSIIAAHKRQAPVLGPEAFRQFTLDANGAAPAGPLAPTAGTGFQGITQNGWIPGEPTSAAGPLNVFTTGNVSVVVANKDGSNRVEVDGALFFGVPSAEGAISDAQCYYDALRGRFVAMAFTEGSHPKYSNYYLAISQTNDARGSWWIYKLDMTLDGSTGTSNWSDYPSLGVSDDKIALTGQQFSFGGNLYQYQKIRILDRAAAYSGATLAYVDLVNFATPPGGDSYDVFVTKAARNLTAGDPVIHCLNVRVVGGSNVTYREVTGPPSAPVISAGNRVTVSAYTSPPDADQLGSGTKVPTNDCRPGDFYVRSGSLYVAWHTGATLGGGTVSAVRLLRLRTSDRAVLTDETYGAAATFYYYPAVTVDSLGTIFLGFDRSSATEYPSSYATGKRRVDAALQASALLKAGQSSTAQSRWGDYTGIDMDAAQCTPAGSVAWYAGQWTIGTNTFGAWVTPLTFTYGRIAGVVNQDCDGLAATTADRTPLAGVTVTLKQGATTLGTTVTDTLGAWQFGYLETGVYDVLVSAPAGGGTVDAVPGSGGNAQTKINAGDLQVDLTNAQFSSANQFAVTTLRPAPVATSIAPSSVAAGSGAFALTVTGSSFGRCSLVRLDGSDRATTFVDGSHLSAAISAADVVTPGTRTITVFTPVPGGGTSSGVTLTVSGATTWTLTTTTNGGGTVLRNPDQPDYADHTQVTVTAQPSTGWNFASWTGDTTATTNPLTFTMVAPRSIEALFADVAPPVVTMQSPNGGESVDVGSPLSVTWTATDNGQVGSVDLLLSRDGAGGPFDPVASGLPNTGSYEWTATGPNTVNALFEAVAHDTAGNAGSDVSDAAFTITGPVGIDDAVVTEFSLSPITPNPIRRAGDVRFALPRASRVRLTVLDLQGREVGVLADGEFAAGRHQARLTGTATRAPGLYFVRFQAGGRTFVQRFASMR